MNNLTVDSKFLPLWNTKNKINILCGESGTEKTHFLFLKVIQSVYSGELRENTCIGFNIRDFEIFLNKQGIEYKVDKTGERTTICIGEKLIYLYDNFDFWDNYGAMPIFFVDNAGIYKDETIAFIITRIRSKFQKVFFAFDLNSNCESYILKLLKSKIKTSVLDI